jgi:CHAD domain-containing protein
MPTLALARTIIDKRFGAVIKKGRRISPATADERLHALRIDCKKLRYLLEFFAALSPTAEIGALIKHLKKLQDNLGAFNDLSVQQAFLIDYLGTITPKGADALLLAAATGGLIARLAADQQRVREAFWAVFAAFDTPQNRKRCNALFVQGSSTPHRS